MPDPTDGRTLAFAPDTRGRRPNHAAMIRVEFLWFDGCPSHEPARALLDDVIAAVAPGTVVEVIDASDPAVAVAHRFPGSPTIRVDGVDIDPNFVDPADYTPRCRLFRTAEGLRGVPPRAWIEDALTGARQLTGRRSRARHGQP